MKINDQTSVSLWLIAPPSWRATKLRGHPEKVVHTAPNWKDLHEDIILLDGHATSLLAMTAVAIYPCGLNRSLHSG